MAENVLIFKRNMLTYHDYNLLSNGSAFNKGDNTNVPKR